MDYDRLDRSNLRDSIRDATSSSHLESSSVLRKGKEKWRGGKKGCVITYLRKKKKLLEPILNANISPNNSTFRKVFFFSKKKERERNIRTRDESDDETDHHVPEEVNFTTRPVIVRFRHDVLIQ